MKRETPLKADMTSVKQMVCPPLTFRRVALLRNQGVSGSVLEGERGGGGRKTAPHGLTQSEYVSKGM